MPSLVELAGTTYNTVAASQTTQALVGSANRPTGYFTGKGAAGDVLVRLVIQPAATTIGVVTVFDGTTAVLSYPGSAAVGAALLPFSVEINAKSVTGAWNITTGASVSVVAVGQFS